MKKKEDTFLLVSLEDSKAKKLATVLSSDTARSILDLLTKGNFTETEIASKLSLPLSTVHYNLRQLMGGGLVRTDEFHYSSKGREVAHYTLAQKYIIIAPKHDEKLISRFKSLLPALLITGAFGWALHLWQASRQAVDTLAFDAAPMMQKTVESGARMMLENGTDTALYAADSALAMAPPQPLPPSPDGFLWFVGGMITLLVCVVGIEVLLYLRREK